LANITVPSGSTSPLEPSPFSVLLGFMVRAAPGRAMRRWPPVAPAGSGSWLNRNTLPSPPDRATARAKPPAAEAGTGLGSNIKLV
jgi:hypothetical protein